MSQKVMSNRELFNQAVPNYLSEKLMALLSRNIHESRGQLLGEVLTIVDASIQDTEQRKAVKDLIRKSFYSENYLDTMGIRYLMAGLSAFLRKLRTTGSAEENATYDDYLKMQDFSKFTNLPEEFSGAELG